MAALVGGCQDREVLVEGPAGTGKTHGDLAYIHSLAWRYPRSRHLICRATRVSMTESMLKTWEEQILGDHHPAYSGNAGRANRHSYDFPNRSSVVVGGLDSPEKLFSTEWDTVLVGEASEISDDDWEKLGRAMRNNRMPYQQRIAETNPSYPAHWLNKRARPIDDTLRIVTTRSDWERLQVYNETHSPGQMRRLVSKHQDNPAYWDFERWDWTGFGKLYVEEELGSMTGHRRARLFEGRWVAADGTVFGAEFDERRHVVDDFDVPADWPWWVLCDPGYDHPCAIPLFTISPNNTLYLADLRYASQYDIADHADWIKERIPGKAIRGMFLDPRHGFMRTAQSPKTISQQFKEAGLTFREWPRKQGYQVEAYVNAVRTLLKQDRLRFFRSCKDAIGEMQSWMHKRTSGGDLPSGDDQYEDRNNHFIDCLLGLVAMPHEWEYAGIRRYSVPVGATGGAVQTPGGVKVYRNAGVGDE